MTWNDYLAYKKSCITWAIVVAIIFAVLLGGIGFGELGGVVPYTAYNAKKSYISENKDVIQGYSNAINKALKYIHSNTALDVAEKISTYFPDSSINDLEVMVQNYMDIDSWYNDTYIDEKDFNHIQEIIKNSGELTKKAPYKKLVTTEYVKK